MSNSIIMWSMFFIPWSSLFFMKKEEVKRWMPVTMFAVVLTTIIHDIGTTLGFWATRESIFPFHPDVSLLLWLHACINNMGF
jgi:hypothetical protein